MATKGGFPQLLLQPINFDALYAQAMQQRNQQGGAQPVTPVVVPEATEGTSSGETH
jgi:preprotein translocase subunit SecB